MNKELLILVGAPGSGKSTFSMDLIRKNPKYTRVNRDDIRHFLSGSYTPDEDLEAVVSSVHDSAIAAALKKGYSVVVDNTHCKSKYIKELITKFAKDAVVSIKYFDVDLKELKKRNETRDKKVPEEVIDRMYKGFNTVVKNKKDIQEHIDGLYRTAIEPIEFKQNDKLPKAILVDIDGTVAHMGDKRGPFEWHKVDVDDADENVLNIIRALSKTYNVVFMSGRDESCRALTTEWLQAYYKNEDIELYMRPTNNYQKDNIVKTDLFNKYIKDKYYVEAVFDDRDQVVKMWREELGLKCMQVAYGNF